MIKQRIRALERKFSNEIAEIEAERAAGDYVYECEQAQEQNRPAPDPFDFCRKLSKTVGYFRLTTGRALQYLYECLEDQVLPDVHALYLMLMPEEARARNIF